MATSHLVFRSSNRGIVRLERGWRTPDPSPTREARELPGCKVELVLCEGDDVWETEDSGDSHGRLLIPQDTESSRQAGSTPSPPSSPVHIKDAWKGAETQPEWSNQRQQPEESESWFNDFVVSSPVKTYPAPRSGTMSEWQGMMETNVPPPPLPTVCMVYLQGGLPQFQVQHENSEGMLCPDMGTDVSAGSMGHPFTCAQPCKYNRKRRGCKDGALCNHCHLCVWKRYGSTKGDTPAQNLAS